MPKVSVLTPVYNVKKYLRHCLDSLAEQALDDIEFICVDDGSTDGSGEILDEYANKDKRFRVIHKANSGYGASMNSGLSIAKGEYIGILESDDFADKDMFESLYKIAEENNAEIVKSNYLNEDAHGTVFFEPLAGHTYDKIINPSEDDWTLASVTPSIWSGLYKKDFLKQHKIIFNETPGASFQDTSFFMLVIACAERVILTSKAYIHYRIDNAGSSVHSNSKIFCILDEYDYIHEFLEKYVNVSNKWYSYMVAIMYTKFCWNERRLSRNVNRRFWLRAVLRLKEADRNGWLNETLFSQNDWQDIQKLMHEVDMAVFRRFENCQKNEYLKASLISELRRSQHFYLYGAGEIAKDMIQKLRMNDLLATGLVVSNIAGNPRSVYDVPVYEINSASVDKENDAIVIAITPNRSDIQREIFTRLDNAGYERVIILTEELQVALL